MTGEPTFAAPAGTFIGWRDHEVVRATGIRYARAERYAPPTPEPDGGEIRADRPAPACPQEQTERERELIGPILDGLGMSEDCLRLSITRPANSAADLPVMVWIHGGSYVHGAGDAPVYDPALLVVEQQVIGVNVTFRLGRLGFLGADQDPPANLGLLDIQEALRWLQRNVSAFGGDPAKITMYGESAGADAIAHLMIAEGSTGLFHRAILQSTPLGLSRNRAEMSAAMLAASRSHDPDGPVEELVRTQPEVLEPARKFGLRGTMAFGVQYGQHPMPPEADVDAAWRAVAREYDVLIGANAREAALFLESIPRKPLPFRMPVVGRVTSWIFITLLSWIVYRRPVACFAKRHRAGGGKVATYLLTWGPKGSKYRAAHTLDIPLLLGTPQWWARNQLIAGMSDEQLATDGRRMREIWGRFARSGQVDAVDLPGLIKIKTR